MDFREPILNGIDEDKEAQILNTLQTWEPIYITIALALLQIVLFLCIFEIGRRRMPEVFDRRRKWKPQNTPPPLMQRRGCCGGWLGFEWWRVRVTPLYIKQSQEEYEGWQQEQINDYVVDPCLEEAMHSCRDQISRLETELPLEDASFPGEGLATEGLEHIEDDELRQQRLPSENACQIPDETDHPSGPAPVPPEESCCLHILSRIYIYFRYNVLKMRYKVEEDGVEMSHSHRMAKQDVKKRPLSQEQRELLRLVGLDAFVVIRFLDFCYDTAFWTLVLASVTVLPAFVMAEGEGEIGYFKTTASNLGKNSNRLWAIAGFGIVQYAFVLRRLWIEWELFIPLRYDFLETGGLDEYQDQFRHTCLVEYVPHSLRRDADLFEFFDSIFPGQVCRTEVFVNTESLKNMIDERQEHIIGFEDAYAKKVHKTAEYLRFQKEKQVKWGWCCTRLPSPSEPREPRLIVVHKIDKARDCFSPQNETVKDPKTYEALPYRICQIERLNHEIDDEYFRLIHARRRVVPPRRPDSFISRWLGLKYLGRPDTTRLRSSTAVVEFRTLTAKQQAIQCNITGSNNLMAVSAVPPVHDVIWDNAPVSKALISARNRWSNMVLVGCIILWSLVVTVIRSQSNLSEFVPAVKSHTLIALLDTYIPVLLIEGLVRLAPHAMKLLARWSRFKALSAIDLFIFRWYFAFRFVSFVFAIIGGSLVTSSKEFVDDPYGFVTDLSSKVPEQAQYFTAYVIVLSGGPGFFFMSQAHRLFQTWFIRQIVTEEALSERKLMKMKRRIRKFATEELIPLYIFISMIGLLYGALAPICLVFVSIFFKINSKITRYMALYLFGTPYESGGALFYTVNNIYFAMMYMMITLLTGYLSFNGTAWEASAMFLMLLVTATVHVGIHRTFIGPSKTLALTKARLSDDAMSDRFKETKLDEYEKVKAALDEAESTDTEHLNKLLERKRQILLANSVTDEESSPLTDDSENFEMERSLSAEERRQETVNAFRQRYRRMSQRLNTAGLQPREEIFAYRQPVLNRELWETAPRPYRGGWNKQMAEHLDYWV